MEIIQFSHPLDPNSSSTGDKVIALGYFDGVHIGHQKVIRTAVEEAQKKGLKSAVMTFHPHPSSVLKQLKRREDYLTPIDEKARLIKNLGVDELYIVKFDESFSQLSPQEFVDTYLIKQEVKHVVAGFDFTYGKMAKGNMETMIQESRNMFGMTVVPKLDYDNEKVSTTHIRELLLNGRVDQAIPLLGRPYSITGMVVHGDKRGRTIGFPTANIKTHAPYLYPELGVYAVQLETEAGTYNGVCNVGVRPTFYEQEKTPLIEVYLFDFEGDLYGETVTVKWYTKIRNEQKFKGLDELKGQIERDKNQTIVFFSNSN